MGLENFQMLLTNVNITWRLPCTLRIPCDTDLRDRAIDAYILALEGERLGAAQAERACEEYNRSRCERQMWKEANPARASTVLVIVLALGDVSFRSST